VKTIGKKLKNYPIPLERNQEGAIKQLVSFWQ